jgi:hypothetical protein
MHVLVASDGSAGTLVGVVIVDMVGSVVVMEGGVGRVGSTAGDEELTRALHTRVAAFSKT